MISDEDFDALKQMALMARRDDYGRVVEAFLHSLGEEAWRPGGPPACSVPSSQSPTRAPLRHARDASL